MVRANIVSWFIGRRVAAPLGFEPARPLGGKDRPTPAVKRQGVELLFQLKNRSEALSIY